MERIPNVGHSNEGWRRWRSTSKTGGELDQCECFIEQLFAWQDNLRGLVVRYERHALDCLGFVHLGSSSFCSVTLCGIASSM